MKTRRTTVPKHQVASYLLVLAVLFIISVIARGYSKFTLFSFSLAPTRLGSTTSVPKGQDDAYVAACTIGKDEHQGIVEWVVYHWAIGVNKFYILDDNSQPPMKTLLQPFIDSGLVEYHYGTTDPTIQRQYAHYDDCLARYRKRHTFITTVDVDEFIILKQDPDLPTFLKRYEQHGCLVLPWRVFGSSDHATPPKDGVLQSYTACMALNSTLGVQGSSIVKLDHVAHISHHSCDPLPGFKVVDVYGTQLVMKPGKHYTHPIKTNLTEDMAFLYHYRTKSWAEYDHKSLIGDLAPKNERTVDRWHWQENLARDTCYSAHPLGRFTMKLLQSMGVSTGLGDPRWTWKPASPMPEKEIWDDMRRR